MSAKLGTPENPEIIDPREPRNPPPPPPPGNSRFFSILRLLSTTLTVMLPAIAVDMLCIWLVRMAFEPNGFLAWLPLIFLAPLAFVLTLVAIAMGFFMVISLLLILSGRGPMQMIRFGNISKGAGFGGPFR